MDLGISGRRAAVAAGSAGLGYGVAAALAAEGVQVAICGRRKDVLEEAAATIGAVPIVADVSSTDGAIEFVRAARDGMGGIDILIPNAGGPPPGNFASVTLDQYLDAFELNCRSAIAMCIETVPDMRAQHWGRIVAITSISVRQPIATLMLSNTARAALTGFLKTLAREVAGDGVTVNSLQPALHATDRVTALHAGGGEDLAAGIPAGYIGDPGDFGRIAAFLCSTSANYITGAAIPVDGGAYGGLQ